MAAADYGAAHKKGAPFLLAFADEVGSGHIQLDTYYEHDNNTGPHPNQQVNAAGLIIDLYFPAYKH